MNVNPLNSSALNAENILSIPLDSDQDSLVFDSFSLQNEEIISQVIRADSTPNRELSRFRNPRANGGQLLGDYFRERHVIVSGYLKQTTAALLETAIDEFKRRLTKREGNLDWKVNGVIRRAIATLSNPEEIVNRREGYHITYCPFELDFLVLEPFWHAVDYTSKTTEGNTVMALSESVENLGTYKADGALTVIVEAAVAVTAFRFENTTNGRGMTITHALVAGDVLEIDGENKTVKINGTEVDYDGVFPEIEYGTNVYTMTTTGTSIQYTYTLKFKLTYL